MLDANKIPPHDKPGTDADRFLRPLQDVISDLIRTIEGQSLDILPIPLDHYELEMWAERGAIYLLDGQNKRRSERVIELRYGTALADIIASLKASPLALALLALLEIEECSEWSHDLSELISDVARRMARDMAERALKRLTPDEIPMV